MTATRYTVANDPDAALHRDSDCPRLSRSTVDTVPPTTDRAYCTVCYTDVCPYCGEVDTFRHTCDTRLHCGACDAPTIRDGDPEALAGDTFDCESCGSANIIPTPEWVADG